MNQIRIDAEKAYKIAAKNWHPAAGGNSEENFLKADAAYEIAKKNLVAAEMQYPTPAEIKKANYRRYMANRGLDN